MHQNLKVGDTVMIVNMDRVHPRGAYGTVECILEPHEIFTYEQIKKYSIGGWFTNTRGKTRHKVILSYENKGIRFYRPYHFNLDRVYIIHGSI